MSFVSAAAHRSAAAHSPAGVGFGLVKTLEDVPDGPSGTVAAAFAATGPPSSTAAAASRRDPKSLRVIPFNIDSNLCNVLRVAVRNERILTRINLAETQY